MLKNCPNPVDVQELQFKSQCRLKIFENKELSTFANFNSLVSCASRYGLMFVGTNSNSFQVIQTKSLENYTPKDKDVTSYPRRNIPMPSVVTHLCVNCDSTILAVVINKEKCPTVLFYNILSFLKKDVIIIKEVRLSATPDIFVREINWNPSIPSVFTACKSDSTLGVYELKGNAIDINELPAAASVTSFCWSPKGKQIAVGSKEGKITQYKPDLKAVKVINEPPLQGPHSLISLQWVSNYQFIGVYQSAQKDGPTCVIVVDAPKTGETTFTNYEDICYSGSSRPAQFYTILEQRWNLLMVASANSTELGVLGSHDDNWTQWIVADSARAELPLSSDHQETLPVGLALDTSSTKPLPWGESSIPPCPLLFILSHHGVLCCFNVVNLKGGAAVICAPSDPVSDLSGLQAFVTQSEFDSLTSKTFASPTVSSGSQTILAIPKPSLPTFGTQGQNSFFGTAQQSTQPLLFGVKSSSEASLFGSQVTLTPIKPQQTTASQTNTLFKGQTVITPINTSQISTTVPKTTEKYSAIFSSLTTPVTASNLQQTSVVITSSVPVKSDSAHLNRQKSQESQGTPTTPKPAVQPSKTETAAMKAETNALLMQMIKDECISLESELKALLHQGRSIKINLGSETEKAGMVSKINDLQDFLNEVVDICVGQNAEVHYLKQTLIQSWAWYEEARSRYNASKDETMSLILRSQPLDSAAEKRLKEIHDTIYHIETQLSQASKALDELWDNFQDYAKKRHRIEMPTMEAIFQSMVRHNAILQKQEYVLKDVSNRIKKKKSLSSSSSLLLSVGKTKDLSESIKELYLEPRDVCQMQYLKVLNRNKNLNQYKTAELRKLLKNKEVLHVTAIKPQISSWSINRSPISKSKQMISILGAQMSPVQKGVAVKSLDFVQSTPVRDREKDFRFSEVPPNTPAQAQPQPFIFREVDNTNTIITSGFTTLPKSCSVIGNVKGSAFVPTAQTFVTNKSATVSSTQPQTTTKINLSATTAATSTFASNLFVFGSASQGLSKFGASVSQPSLSISNSPNTSSVSTIDDMLKNKGATSTTSKSIFSFSNTSSVFGTKPVLDTSQPTTTKSLFAVPNTTINATSSLNAAKNDSKNVFSNTSNISAVSTKGVTSSSFALLTPQSQPLKTSSSESEVKVTTSLVRPISSIPDSTYVFSNWTQGSTKCIVEENISDQAISTPDATSQEIDSTPASVTAVDKSSYNTTASITPSSFFVGTSFSNQISGPKEQKLASVNLETPVTISVTTVQAGSFETQNQKSVVAITPITASIFTTAPKSENTAGSVFEGARLSLPTISKSESTPMIFGKSTAISETTKKHENVKIGSIFGGGSATTPVTTGKSENAGQVFFGGATIMTGTTSKSEIPSPIFQGQTTTSSTTKSENTVTTAELLPILGGNSTSSGTSSIFGGATGLFNTSPLVSQSSIFPSATTTSSLLFGDSANGTIPTSTLANTKGSIFSSASVTQPSGFGNATTQSSVFSGTTTPQPSPFGSSTQSSVFSSASVTQPSVFGTAVPSTTIFGTTNITNATSPFQSTFGTTTSANASPFVQQTGSIFGATKTTSVFGQPANQSIFSSTSATTTSIFEKPTFGTTPSSSFGAASTPGNIFGRASVPGFGAVSSSGSIFGSAAEAQPSAFSFAPASNTTVASSFGFGGLSVGGAVPSGGSIFGAQSPTLNTEPKNPFGVTNQFGSPTVTSGSIFGSSTSATFGNNTSGGFGSSFGSSSIFGQQKSSFGQNTFGSTSFGDPQPGPFSGGSSPIAQTGFGSPQSFSKPSGFGGQPVFGATAPAFGGAPSFGGSPTFGNTPTFGSPGKVFGETSVGFGAATAQQNTGFGNIANQNTVGFGSLAQQATSPTSTPFTGSSSFSSWRC